MLQTDFSCSPLPLALLPPAPAARRSEVSSALKPDLADFNPGGLDAPQQLSELRQRLQRQTDGLAALVSNCEVLEHIERRTVDANHVMAGKLQELRQQALKLEAEASQVRALGEEAATAMHAARRELASAREAIEERRRAYAECKVSRETVIKEKGELKSRQTSQLKARLHTCPNARAPRRTPECGSAASCSALWYVARRRAVTCCTLCCAA